MDRSKDKIYLEHMLEAILDIEKFVSSKSYSDFTGDKLLQAGIQRKLEILGEAAKNVSQELKEKYPEIDWKPASALRDVIIHAYFDIDLESLWNTVENNLPVLKEKLNIVLNQI